MPFVPDCAHDVYVSYAATDGEWAAHFQKALQHRLRTMVGADVSVCAGRKEPRSSAALVAVLSAAYLRSAACLLELSVFAAEAGAHRVFLVCLEPIDRTGLPEQVRSLLAYPFFEARSDALRPFPWRDETSHDYWLALDDVCHDVAKTFQALVHPEAQGNMSAAAPAVFLAESSADVEIHRTNLRRALMQKGVRVLPETLLPRTRNQLRAAVERDLSECAVAVHLLGSAYGDVLTDADVSVARAQAEVVAEVARTRRLPRIVWKSSRTPATPDSRQNAFERWITTEEAPDDLLSGGLEELKAVVFAALPPGPESAVPPAVTATPPSPAPVPGPPQMPAIAGEVFISYSRADATEFATALSKALKDRGVKFWMDTSGILGGAMYRDEIDAALKRCTQMLVILSPRAVKSPEVKSEVNQAIRKRKTVVPVLFMAIDEDDIPYYLNSQQHVSFIGRTADDDTTLSVLLRALHGARAEAG
jgi:hypothetical protein